jgi:hypothetical protein
MDVKNRRDIKRSIDSIQDISNLIYKSIDSKEKQDRKTEDVICQCRTGSINLPKSPPPDNARFTDDTIKPVLRSIILKFQFIKEYEKK